MWPRRSCDLPGAWHPKKGPLRCANSVPPSILPALTHRQASLSPAERSLRARLAAYAMHARHDARRTSANGRAAFLARFEREVDPNVRLDP
jgi:hypothetical protein